ncbi:MAG TPA: type I-E CRISPR-associated protein Cse1/CasA, partial [Methylomirabilota bacterium]|nr:type I-E CRISPR-associated protein Cse1/CasA [Methylomirabilota bacterium]
TVLAVEKKGQWERYLLGANLNKQPWRDLQNVFRVTNGGAAARPLPLQRSEPAPYRKLWLGALVTDGKAKYEDTVEAVYDAPRELLSEDHRAIYEAGINHANKCCFTLKKAVSDYAQVVEAETETTRAERHYWNSLDQRVPALFDAARVLGSDEFPAKDAAWTRFCEGAARAAYEHACPSETPRQIQAFATGLKRLRFSKSKPKPRNP